MLAKHATLPGPLLAPSLVPLAMLPEPRILLAGDSAFVIEFGDVIDPGINARVIALDVALQAAAIPGVIETVPTYRSLLVQVDPLVLAADAFIARVLALAASAGTDANQGRRWSVPVVYGGAFGIDLDDVAARHQLTPNQVIDRHAGAIYRVYAIGFMPGYTYLGGLDPSIATPRRLDPRLMTPAGTISIGGIQALVAGAAMPSGWHLLGRTPVRTFAATRSPPVLFAPGDEIIFQPIGADRWAALDQAALAGDPIAEVVRA
jgi:5-oxoprolinase (ATP-hydrolysing) subunit B